VHEEITPLLARYFAAREVLQDFDFAAIKETKIGALLPYR